MHLRMGAQMKEVRSKGKEEAQVAQQKEQVDEEGDKEPEGEKEKEVASEDGGADEGGEKSKGKEEAQVAQQKEQVDEEGDKEPEGEKEKEVASEDGGADEGGEKGKGKEVAHQQEGASEPMDEDEEEHAGGEEAEKVAHQQKDKSEGEGDKEGQDKEVTKKCPASTEEGGSSKRAKFDPPAPSAQQQTQGSYPGEATQEPIYSIDELKKAISPYCLPYMDWAMQEEEVREYLTSFINDKRIPTQTLFNLFQTSIKLYNVGGGSRKMGIWDHDSDAPGEELPIKNHIFNDTDMMFDPEEIGGRTSATYPSEKEDVEMRDLHSSSAGGF
ncbi:hypothetical protein EDB84DRAFT_1571634 [Lactarius hengduanensis]|nr:hypothetical protein EDB84DRAFT_1571634 [Lactarius hengduanensis]